MRLRMRLETELLRPGQLETVFQQALVIWREVPFRVQGADEFFAYLSDYGCRIAGEKVWFPQPVIEKVLARVRAEKQAWEAAHAGGPPPWPGHELRMFTHGQALHICDLETNELRQATTADLAAWCRLVDGLPGGVGREHPTFIPQDAPRGAQDFHAYATVILNSRRPGRVSVYSAKMLPFFIEATRVALGSLEAVKATPVFATKCWVTSPFMLTRENVDLALEARRLLGWPLTFGMMPVAGASTPLTLAGALAQNTAESLALTAMRLAVDDLPHGITGTSAVMDMKDVAQRQSGPDLLLHAVAGIQMHTYLFGGCPSFAHGYTGVGAKVVSAQSVYEKALSAAFSVAAGGRNLGIGCLAYSDVGSPVQLLLDYEMGRYFQSLLREVVVDEGHIGLDTILATAPSGAFYLSTDHTARHFREESWLPEFLDHRSTLTWLDHPTDMIAVARNRARELITRAENRCPLSEADRRTIRMLMTEAAAAVRDD